MLRRIRVANPSRAFATLKVKRRETGDHRFFGNSYQGVGEMEMFNPALLGPLSDLNEILFVSFGIWFTVVCFIKMVETAIRANQSDD